MMKKHMIISILVFFVTLSFFTAFVVAAPKPRGYPDQWLPASDYDITTGDYYYGLLSDTFTNDGNNLAGKCYYVATPWIVFNAFEIEFDFYDSHYRKVRLEGNTDILGISGEFGVYAVYTSGSPRKVYLGVFNPGTATRYFTIDRHKVLDKIIVDYLQFDVYGIRVIYFDEIRALWTSV
ncbi:MAG: hypothetical protein ACXACY_07000 [Candidatus Hodarchaeales archaeon]|jgi:hypothetical protein